MQKKCEKTGDFFLLQERYTKVTKHGIFGQHTRPWWKNCILAIFLSCDLVHQ